MAYYVGMWISNVYTSALGLSFLCIYALVLVVISIKTIYDYHKENLN